MTTNVFIAYNRDLEDGWLLGQVAFEMPHKNVKTVQEAIDTINVYGLVDDRFVKTLESDLHEALEEECIEDDYSIGDFEYKELLYQDFKVTFLFEAGDGTQLLIQRDSNKFIEVQKISS